MRENDKKQAIPYGLIRLYDMINFSFYGVVMAVAGLDREEALLRMQLKKYPDLMHEDVDEAYLKRITIMLNLIESAADDFQWCYVKNNINRLRHMLVSPIKMYDLMSRLNVLRETIEDGLKFQKVYRYPDDKGAVFENWKQDWDLVLQAFPECKNDIVASVDLWALQHNTATVFHLMRVLEVGLGAFAQNVGVVYSTQNWYNLINEVEKAIRQEGNQQKSPEKEKRMQFLSEAAKEFSYFKDGWRNYVSHKKCVYDEHQAKSVMEHVRCFMITLAVNLDCSAKSSSVSDQTLDCPNLHQAPERSQ